MKCPKFQFDNGEGAKACNECSNKLEIACPECGKINRLGSRFCDECGHNLRVPSEPPPKDLSLNEKLAKIQQYLPKGLTEKILASPFKDFMRRPLVFVPDVRSGCDSPAAWRIRRHLAPKSCDCFLFRSSPL
ncbi:MAG: hypothetical protein GTO12_17470 [Proteobacteria bacterium]|nr:hypothetical protein [Pseudomonadota bacterium]